jgi:hypothetical protein
VTPRATYLAAFRSKLPTRGIAVGLLGAIFLPTPGSELRGQLAPRRLSCASRSALKGARKDVLQAGERGSRARGEPFCSLLQEKLDHASGISLAKLTSSVPKQASWLALTLWEFLQPTYKVRAVPRRRHVCLRRMCPAQPGKARRR